MAKATVTFGPSPELGEKMVIDCPHGTTTIHLHRVNGIPTDAEVLNMAVLKHELEEGCGCAFALQRRRTH